MTFTRTKSAEDVFPSDSEPSAIRPAQSWNTASPALIPISEVKAKAKAKAQAGGGAAISPAGVPPKPVTPTRISPTKVPEPPRPLSAGATNSISISVKDSSNATKDFGRASLGSDGVTVCLKSYNKPEDMEVSWTCVPRLDEEGRAFTQWEMKFRPRLDPTSSSGLPSQAPPPLPAPPLSSANSNFLNYRINGHSSSSTSPFAHPPTLRQPSTTSPLSQATVDPLLSSGSLPSVERRRKSSSTSTSRSDSFSNGTSFSSESSVGPPTPASYLASSQASPTRRRKSSSISHTLATYDFGDSKPPPLPTSTTSSYFDIPVPPLSKPAHDEQISPSRTSRSSSYNPGAGANQRSRQFSIDPSVYVPRSASVPDAGVLVSAPVKSPRDNRFARCLPPANEAKVDLFSLSTTSTSNSAPSSSSSPSSFLASRNNLNGGGGSSSGRKGSFCTPPPHLSLPSSTTTIAEELSSHGPHSGSSVTSPFAPSPLGRNVVYLSDQNRTPTRPTHFNLPPCKLTTTPSPPPPPPKYQPPSSSTESSFTTATESSLSSFGIALRGGGRDGGTSEELTSLSPALSIDEDEDEEAEEEEAEEEAFGRRMARNRQGKRMMSRWSDTETEEDEELENIKRSEGLTSWGKLPDSNTTDEEA